MALRDYRGSARSTYTTVALGPNDMLIQTEGLTGWPDGDPGPFFVVINRQKSNEEKILCVSHNGTDLVVVPLEDGASGRGADETAPQNHAVGSVVEHIITATDAREANLHVNDHNAHVQSGSGADRPDTDLFPGQMYYDTDTMILWIYGADGEWHASTAFPQLEENLDMQNKYRIVNLVDPVDPQDGVTKSYLEGRIPELTGDDVELAKAWAIKMDGPVQDDEYSSKYHATNAASDAADAAASQEAAANSATSAAASAASAAALYQDFDKRYLGAKPNAPIADNEGLPLETGALYFNTTDDQMYVWDGDQWIVASSAAIDTFDQYEWTATDGQTVFTTTKDMNPTMLQVYVNGVMVAKSDYTADVRSVTLVEPAMAGDLVQVHAFQEATILSNVITSQDVDYVKVLPFDSWPIADPDDRTLYVVLPEAGKDYGTLWLGSVQIGGAGGGGLEGSPPPPINLRWNSDDPGVSDYRLLEWDSGGMGDAGPTIGYGVLPANDAAKETTITQTDSATMNARITGTEAGVEYAYKVFAANLAGPGESTEPITRMFPGPDAPTNVRSDPSDAFKLMWDHPGTAAILGDPDVDNYEVEDNIVTRANISINVSGKTATLDPNDYSANSQFYRFRVRAYGPNGGWSDWSEDFQREFVVPNAPTNVRCEGTTLKWDYTDVDTGPVTGWTFDQSHPVESSPPNAGTPETVKDAVFGSVTKNGNTYSLPLTNTTPFADYTFTVQATNQQGTGPVSMASAAAQFNYNEATGGSETVVDNYNGTGEKWRVHVLAVGTHTLDIATALNPFRVLAAAGGGPRGGSKGGGGGAGGFYESQALQLAVSAYAITVGGPSANTDATSLGLPLLIRGGGGGSEAWGAGGSGGSGGGASGTGSSGPPNNISGGAGTSGQGHNGGGLGMVGGAGGAGGGGAGGGGQGAGARGTSGSFGGAAVNSNITGTSRPYCGGGGGNATDWPNPGSGASDQACDYGGGGSNRNGVVIVAYQIGTSTTREIAQAQAEQVAREAGYATGYDVGVTKGREQRDAEIVAAVETKVEEVTDKSKRSRKKAD